jgi:hypothetical protein
MLVGLMQVAGDLEDHRDLGSQRAGTSHIFRQDAGAFMTIQDAECSSHLICSAKQRHDENLPDMEPGDQVKIRVGQLAGVV